MDRRNAFYVQESDAVKNAAEYIKSLESATKTFKSTLKQRKELKKSMMVDDDDDDDDEEEDGMIDEIIHSVFTDNQSSTLNQEKDTLSKKGKLARGDVRGVFSNQANPVRSSINGPLPSANHSMDDSIDWNKGRIKDTNMTPPADYSDDEVSILDPHLLRNSNIGNQVNRVYAVNQSLQSKYKSLNSKTSLPRTSFLINNSIAPNEKTNPGLNRHDNHTSSISRHEIAGSGSIKNGKLSASKGGSGVKPNGSYNFDVQKNGLVGVEMDGMDGRMDGRMETRIEHLGRSDINLLKVFAETEIRTVFRENGNIKFNKMTTKRKSKDTGIFGVSLEHLVTRDHKKLPSLRAPLFIVLLISRLEEHVNEEGILRVPGNQARIKETVYNLETCDNPLPFLQALLPHDLAGLLKHFFRTLPQPLFTLKYLDAFCKALGIQDATTKLHAFQTLVCLLPDAYRATLQLLMELLLKMSNSHSNRMTLETVTMVISPSLFALPSPLQPPSSFSSEIEHLSQFNGVILYILRNSDVIWNVPKLFLTQIREVGTKAANRAKKLKKKKPENNLENIYIHSLHPDKSQKSFQINEATTVSEALNAFNRFGNPRFDEAACLFENGGFIDQRLLHPHEHISSILRHNPNARLSLSLQSPHSIITHSPPELYH